MTAAEAIDAVIHKGSRRWNGAAVAGLVANTTSATELVQLLTGVLALGEAGAVAARLSSPDRARVTKALVDALVAQPLSGITASADLLTASTRWTPDEWLAPPPGLDSPLAACAIWAAVEPGAWAAIEAHPDIAAIEWETPPVWEVPVHPPKKRTSLQGIVAHARDMSTMEALAQSSNGDASARSAWLASRGGLSEWEQHIRELWSSAGSGNRADFERLCGVTEVLDRAYNDPSNMAIAGELLRFVFGSEILGQQVNGAFAIRDKVKPLQQDGRSLEPLLKRLQAIYMTAGRGMPGNVDLTLFDGQVL